MFGGIPSAPTPPNVSPLDLTPPQASLLSPYNDLRASFFSQSSLPGSSKTMRSATPTIPQPVQPQFPPRTKHESPHVNTTHHHRAQPESTGPASGGRRLGFWGRLLKPFRVSFHALLCIPKRPETETERPEPTPSVSPNFFFHFASSCGGVDLTVIQSRHGTTGDATNGEDVRPPGAYWDSGGGRNAISSTQNNSNTHSPPQFASLDASEGSSPKGGCLPVPTSDGAHEEGAPTEANIGTPEQQPPADLDPPMPAAQPISSSPNLVPPPTDASAEPPSYAETLYTEVSGHHSTICSNLPRP